ncbi:hypothetical protein IFM89_025767 [Coptis chinensis]|uniref:Uncharacterized protein n=1 Tax=Coptis chinensis TaxID=261450 RepID=A0A835HYI1_9MAGN|nr:hypothetical protein IFM89_025767 [Coptis chinensis]
MEVERDNMYEVPCISIAADSTLRIAAAGTIWGLTSGPYNARKLGLTGLSKASYVVKSAGSSGLQCGIFAGIYSTTHCGIQKYRGKKDMLNASISGAVTGAVFAARSRSWIKVFGMAALVASITTAAEFSTAT